MISVEIFFSDLNEKGQKKLLDALGYKDPSEGNYDIDMCPIAILDFEESTSKVEMYHVVKDT